MTSWQKAIKYLAMVFAIFLSVSIIGGICSGLASVSFIFSGSEKNAVGEMQTYPVIEKITELSIDVSAADFAIKTDDELRIESNNKYLTVNAKDGKLIISEEKKTFASLGGNVKIDVYIPDDLVFDRAKISTGAGRVKIETLSADIIDLDFGAGEVEIGSLTANSRADIDGGAGKITINGGLLHNLELDIDVGELNLTSCIEGKSSVDCGIGETNLCILGSADDYEISLDKGLGEARLDGEKMSGDSVYGNGKNRLEISGGIGEINISFKNVD